MEDQKNLHASKGNHTPNRASNTATERNEKMELPDIVLLIRSIQRLEGDNECFKTVADCLEVDCAWYLYCMKED